MTNARDMSTVRNEEAKKMIHVFDETESEKRGEDGMPDTLRQVNIAAPFQRRVKRVK